MLQANENFFRKPHDDIYVKSDILEEGKKAHSPYLVINPNNGMLEQYSTLREILIFPDETQVLWRWMGQYRSDMFLLTVGQIRSKL